MERGILFYVTVLDGIFGTVALLSSSLLWLQVQLPSPPPFTKLPTPLKFSERGRAHACVKEGVMLVIPFLCMLMGN